MEEDINTLIEQLPDPHMSMPFKVRKRICASTNGYQFLTSGYPNRNNKNKAEFSSVDGIFVKGLLPGLRWNEHTTNNDNRQGIPVDVHISRISQDGWQKMWVFGYELPEQQDAQRTRPGWRNSNTYHYQKHGERITSDRHGLSYPQTNAA